MADVWEGGVVHICIASTVLYIIIYFAGDGTFTPTELESGPQVADR